MVAPYLKYLGLLYRHFYGYADDNTLKQLYLSLVRPHLDYACQIWDPHLAKDKVKLENVQKFACKLASHQWDAGYQELLELFELPTLEERRLELKMGLLLKILHELCYFPETDSFMTLRATAVPNEMLIVFSYLFPLLMLTPISILSSPIVCITGIL